MPPPTIPDSVLARHPELLQIAEALEAHRAGRAVNARCPTCGRVLAVTEYPEIGSRWVTCDTGCTKYHERYKPEATG
jgi:hypothetical protein